MLRVSEALARRFWAKVDRSAGPDGCWPWIAGTFPRGYGAFQFSARRTVRAHRLALAMSGAEVPDGATVCHRCDNPPCCNPAHLWVGDAAANAADCVSKDRQSRGSRNGRAKFVEADIIAIRACAARGESQRSIARRYGVTPGAIHHIVIRRNWRHV